MKIYGYCRTNILVNCFVDQLELLSKYKCDRVFKDISSGLYIKDLKTPILRLRPSLAKLLKTIKQDDFIVVSSLDRFGLPLSELIHILNNIEQKGAHIISIKEGIKTFTRCGTNLFSISKSFQRCIHEIENEKSVIKSLTSIENGKKSKGRPRKN